MSDEALARVADRHALSVVVLFGSRAQHRPRPGSDTDLGVLRRGGRRLTFRELGALQLDLREVWSESAEVSDLATDDAVFRFEVVRDGRLLYEDRPGRWSELVAQTLIDHADLAPFIEACVAGVRRRVRLEAQR